MKSNNIHRTTHIQEQCDTWLSTKNRVKTTPKPKKQSKAPGRKTVSSIYEIQWSQTPTDFKATKQTKLLKYMQTNSMKKERLSAPGEDPFLQAENIGLEEPEIMIEKDSKSNKLDDKEHRNSYRTSPKNENISCSSRVLLKDLTPTNRENLNKPEKAETTFENHSSVSQFHGNKPEHSQKRDLDYQEETEDSIVAIDSHTQSIEEDSIDTEEFTFHTQKKKTEKRKRHLVDENSQHFCDKIDDQGILVKDCSLEFDNDSQISDTEDFTFHSNVFKDSQNENRKRRKYSKDLNDIDEDFTFHTQLGHS